MATNSINKLVDIGHEITLHLADPNKPVTTTWSGYTSPTTGYAAPPNPYTEPDNPSSRNNNIRVSTGFDGFEPGTSSQFLRVPLDGPTFSSPNENSPQIYEGGGFVRLNDQGLTAGFIVKNDTNTVDIDLTAMVKWYLTINNPSLSRMRILGKGSYVKPSSGDIETPYGYLTDFAPEGSGLRPSESYMITEPKGPVNETTEVVTTPGRRATVEFYSFGETADEYPRFSGNYIYGNINIGSSVSPTGGGILVSVNQSDNTVVVTLDITKTDVNTFWRLIKSGLAETTFTRSLSFAATDVVTAETIGTAVLTETAENPNQVILSFSDYNGTIATVNDLEVSNINIQSTSPSAVGHFIINRLITTQTGSITGPFGNTVYLENYETVDSGTHIYFPQGITLSDDGEPLTINGNGTKRFKVKNAFTSNGTLKLQLDSVWSTNTSSSQVNSIRTSTGRYRPKLIVSYNTD